MVTVKRLSEKQNGEELSRLGREIVPYLAPGLAALVNRLPENLQAGIEEIRLRSGKPIALRSGCEEYTLTEEGQVASELSRGYLVSQEQVQACLEIMTQSSIYAWQEELKQGFLTLRGGHRVGLTGKVIVEQDRIKTIRPLASLNLRISRQLKGVGRKVIPYLASRGSMLNTLIISPPQAGKTTLLRDIARLASDGDQALGLKGATVGVVDERSELAGCWDGVPQNDLGLRTDVLDCCPKSLGMVMLLRAMSPQVIVTDELGRPEDIAALEEAVNCGVTVVTTVHGKDENETLRKPLLGKVVASGVFSRIMILSRRLGVGTVEKVIDYDQQKVITPSAFRLSH